MLGSETFYGKLRSRDIYIILLNFHILILSFIAFLAVRESSIWLYLPFGWVGLYAARIPRLILDSDEAKGSDGVPSGIVRLWVCSILFSFMCSSCAMAIAYALHNDLFWLIIFLPIYNALSLIYMWFIRGRLI